MKSLALDGDRAGRRAVCWVGVAAFAVSVVVLPLAMPGSVAASRDKNSQAVGGTTGSTRGRVVREVTGI